MSQAILTTVLGPTVTLIASFDKLAMPRLTPAPKAARQALKLVVKMLSTP
jgi:hypothetical protein